MWRETISSTANLGFRIEGIKKDDLKSKDFKTIKSRDEIMDMFKEFCAGYPHALVSLERDSYEVLWCGALRFIEFFLKFLGIFMNFNSKNFGNFSSPSVRFSYKILSNH